MIFWILIAFLAASLAIVGHFSPALTVSWGQWQMAFNPSIGFLALGAGLGAMGLVVKSLFALQGWLMRRNTRQTTRRQQTANGWLLKNLMALSAGDHDQARSSATQFAKAQGQGPLTSLIHVHTCALVGDEPGRIQAVRQLLAHEETQDYAQRLMVRQAFLERDWPRAAKMTAQTLAERPQARWAHQMHIAILAQQADWQGALAAAAMTAHPASGLSWLKKRLRRHQAAPLTPSQHSALLTALGQEHLIHKRWEDALSAFRQATKESPNCLVPATIGMAASLLALHKRAAAQKRLRRAWQVAPHPELMGAWLSTHSDSSLISRFQKAEKLAQLTPHAYQAHLCLAGEALNAGLIGVCQKHADWCLENHPTQAVHHIRAKLQQLANNVEESRASLELAMHAPVDPAWICNACGHVHSGWAAVCTQCCALGTLTWDSPHNIRQTAHITSSQALTLAY